MNKNSMNLTENLIKFHFILMEKMGEYFRDIFFIEMLIVNAYLTWKFEIFLPQGMSNIKILLIMNYINVLNKLGVLKENEIP